MTQPILFTRKIEGAVFNFICQRTTNARDGQPRLTVQVFETAPAYGEGMQVSYIDMPQAKINKAGVYVMPYRFEGDYKQYQDFISEFMDKIDAKIAEELA